MKLQSGKSAFAMCFLLVSFLGATFAGPAQAQQDLPVPLAEKPKIRAVTAFINLDRTQYQRQFADAFKMLKAAKLLFELRGYPVQTLRIATQPFPEYTKGLTTQQAVTFFKGVDELAAKDDLSVAIGPAMLNPQDSAAQADMLEAILENTSRISGTVMVASDDGIRWAAVGAAARTIKKLSESTGHGDGNFRFAAIAMVKPLTPFFPAAYQTGFGHQFAIGLESANVVTAAFKNAPDLATASQRLTDRLATEGFNIQRLAGQIDSESGWTYMGMDLSPAPSKDASIGTALENLIDRPVGLSGTLTAAATVTAALKNVGVKQTGYSGLMLPILEDPQLALRWSEGHITIDGLLSYSAVCGTGLDTVPLPGDVTVEEIDLIIGDVASLAYKWHKPLSARLLPSPGKEPGDMTDFQDSHLVNVAVQPLDRPSRKQ